MQTIVVTINGKKRIMTHQTLRNTLDKAIGEGKLVITHTPYKEYEIRQYLSNQVNLKSI